MPKGNNKNDHEEKLAKARIIKVINDPINPDMDEADCRYWMSWLPEARRYLFNKIKVCQARINNIELELEVIKAEIGKKMRTRGVGSATERKAIIEDTFITDPRYVEKYQEIYRYNELIDKYRADLDNLTEKSFNVRKIADFERTHYAYEE